MWAEVPTAPKLLNSGGSGGRPGMQKEGQRGGQREAQKGEGLAGSSALSRTGRV